MSDNFRKMYSELRFLETLRSGDTELFKNFPFYRKNFEGLPAPGPDFVEYAELLKKDGIDYKTHDFELEALYYRALYDDNFVLPLSYLNKKVTVNFVLGGLWTEQATGPVPSPVMIVVKQPHVKNHYNRKVLVGNAGEILANCFEEEGFFDKQQFYITSVIKHDHPDTKGGVFKASWIKNCSLILQQEIKLVRPSFILALGSEAITAVLGKGHTTSNTQGRVMEIKVKDGKGEDEFFTAKVITGISPAAVLKKPERSDDLKGVVRVFLNTILGQEKTEEVIAHRTIKSLDEAKILVQEILNEPDSNVVAVDAEWHGSYPTEKNAYVRTIQISWKPGKAACFVLHNQGGESEIEGGIPAVIEELSKVFTNTPKRKVRVVGHYLNADMPWLMHVGLDIRSNFVAPMDSPGANGKEKLFGYQKTKKFGGFDTLLAAHSVNETGDFKLEVLGTRYVGVPRYDVDLQKWKKSYCEQNKINSEQLEGYGDCPDEILIPYGNYDADCTRRLFDFFNGKEDQPGALDRDSYGNNSRKPFWVSMRASSAFGEMHMTGLQVDLETAETLTEHYLKAKNRLLEILRKELNWPEFNTSSVQHCREMMFGEQYNGVIDKETFKPKSVRPEGALSLYLEPYKSTGKRPKMWKEIKAKNIESDYAVSTDKEVLQILSDKHPCVELLRDLRYVAQLTRYVLRPGKGVEEGSAVRDEDGRIEYESGLLSYLHADNRVRSQFFQTKETGRASSARPPLQNLGKTAEEKYKAVFKRYGSEIQLEYKMPLRSIIRAKPGHVFVDADYTGAELAIMAWQSGDLNMSEHVRRSGLPEDHPDYYDIHSNVAVNTFGLSCPPTKQGLKSIGKSALRSAAKAVVFGYAYGQQAEATARKAKQEGADVTVDQARQLIEGLVSMYPALPKYFEECRERSQDPGYIVNCFGRYRRFTKTSERDVAGEQQRQAMNFPVQSAVADAMSRALDHLYWYRLEAEDPELWYDIVLQVHDAVVLEVPVNCVDWVVNSVIPECMSNRVDVWPCNLDGTRKGSGGPYHLQVPPPDVFTRWSVPITKEECAKLGINESYGAG